MQSRLHSYCLYQKVWTASETANQLASRHQLLSLHNALSSTGQPDVKMRLNVHKHARAACKLFRYCVTRHCDSHSESSRILLRDLCMVGASVWLLAGAGLCGCSSWTSVALSPMVEKAYDSIL